MELAALSHALSPLPAPGGQAPAFKAQAYSAAQEKGWEALLAAGRMPADAKQNRGFIQFLCRQLESTAINGLFRAARKTVPSDGPFSGGFAGSMFQGLADEEYSRLIAARGGFGLGDALFAQLDARRAYAQQTAAIQAQHTAPQELTDDKTPGTSGAEPQGAPQGSDN